MEGPKKPRFSAPYIQLSDLRPSRGRTGGASGDASSDDDSSDDDSSDDDSSGDGSGGEDAGGDNRAAESGDAPRGGRLVGSEARPRTRDTSVISRKELARELRREAYQRAKKARAADPKHLALKEAAKQRRREVYQEVKKRRKAQDAELEAKHKVAQAQARTEAKRQLAERVKNVIAKATEPGQSLARDIERALQSADVRELMERLTRESPALAAQDRNAQHRDEQDRDDEQVR
jgi:hypothetical protein